MDTLIINPEEPTLKDKFFKERLEWTKKLEEISLKLKTLDSVAELMTTLYTERQRAVEYYHYIISLLISLNRKYKKSWDDRFEYWTKISQYKYPNEATKNNKIQVELAEQIEIREMLENHSKFILQVINTLDNVIYAVPRRIEIEQINRGK